MIDENKPLNDKQLLFVEEYIINNFNATAAYTIVYPDADYDAARREGSRAKNRPNVKKAINDRMEEILGDAKELSNKVLLKLSSIAFADKQDEFYAASAQLKGLELIQKQLGLQTTKIDAKVDTTSIVEINITD